LRIAIDAHQLESGTEMNLQVFNRIPKNSNGCSIEFQKIAQPNSSFAMAHQANRGNQNQNQMNTAANDKRAVVIGGSLAGLFTGTLLRLIGW
jgi:uncharacterized protein YllA (UPF0747 family)